VYGIWWIYDRCIWWLIRILLLLFKNIPLLIIEEYFAKKTWATLFISIFFSGGHQRTHCFILLDTCPLFHTFFFSSFFQYFCIATCIFLQQNFGETITRILSIYLGLSYRVYFWVFTLSVRAKHF
jgi:hypothetical protein